MSGDFAAADNNQSHNQLEGENSTMFDSVSGIDNNGVAAGDDVTMKRKSEMTGHEDEERATKMVKTEAGLSEETNGQGAPHGEENPPGVDVKEEGVCVCAAMS